MCLFSVTMVCDHENLLANVFPIRKTKLSALRATDLTTDRSTFIREPREYMYIFYIFFQFHKIVFHIQLHILVGAELYIHVPIMCSQFATKK
jgi:hypothetical protein